MCVKLTTHILGEDRILAIFRDGHYYPATIEKIVKEDNSNRKKYYLKWEDGDTSDRWKTKDKIPKNQFK